jgi:hypothetical protein
MYGFGALPGTEDRRSVTFLTSDEIDEKHSARVGIDYSSEIVFIDLDNFKGFGFVRCIKD